MATREWAINWPIISDATLTSPSNAPRTAAGKKIGLWCISASKGRMLAYEALQLALMSSPARSQGALWLWWTCSSERSWLSTSKVAAPTDKKDRTSARFSVLAEFELMIFPVPLSAKILTCSGHGWNGVNDVERSELNARRLSWNNDNNVATSAETISPRRSSKSR